MITQERINHFHTLGFLVCRQLFSPNEMRRLSAAFDAAMRSARDDAETPALEQDTQGNSKKRQQVVPFFDYDPEAFYPLLDDARLMNVFGALLL